MDRIVSSCGVSKCPFCEKTDDALGSTWTYCKYPFPNGQREYPVCRLWEKGQNVPTGCPMRAEFQGPVTVKLEEGE
jgi:hypothetical protein